MPNSSTHASRRQDIGPSEKPEQALVLPQSTATHHERGILRVPKDDDNGWYDWEKTREMCNPRGTHSFEDIK